MVTHVAWTSGSRSGKGGDGNLYFAPLPPRIWVLLGALRSEGFLAALVSAGAWEGRGTCRTAWAVPPISGCQCSYSYGHGPAIGPHTGPRCFRLLSRVWRALAPLMTPWCAKGEMPSAANLNLYGGQESHVAWHCDDEPLFGRQW